MSDTEEEDEDDSLLTTEPTGPTIPIKNPETTTATTINTNRPDPTQRVGSPFNYVPLYSSSLNSLYQEDVDLITEKFSNPVPARPKKPSIDINATETAANIATQLFSSTSTSTTPTTITPAQTQPQPLEKPATLRQKLTRRLSKSKRTKQEETSPTVKVDAGGTAFLPTAPTFVSSTKPILSLESTTQLKNVPSATSNETFSLKKGRHKHSTSVSSNGSSRSGNFRSSYLQIHHQTSASASSFTYPNYSRHTNNNHRFSILSPRPQMRPNLVVFDELQSLAWEKDPLIDSSSISKIIKCGMTTLLQRKYSPNGDVLAPPKYEEKVYFDSEQTMNSPWSCSPAPSPAIHDSQENPFFKDYAVSPKSTTCRKSSDGSELESAFSQGSSDSDTSFSDYTKKNYENSFILSGIKESVSAIGCENTVSIIHIPLIVPTKVSINKFLGKMEYNNTSPPIAVLSIMSHLIPYPGDLSEHLKQFSSHIATALVNAKAHTNLSNQIDSITSSSVSFRPHHNHRLSAGSAATIYSGSSSLQSPTSTISPEKSARSARHRERLKRMGSFAFKYGYAKRLGYASTSSASTSKKDDKKDLEDESPHHHRPSLLSNPSSSRSLLPVRHLRKILESIPIQIYTMEPAAGNICWVSNRVTSYRGQTYDEFCADPYKSIHPKDRDDFISSLHEAFRTGEAFSRMVYLRRFDGAYRATIYRCYPLRDDRGVTVFWLCTLFDVHQQRKAELAAIKRAKETAGDHKYKILAESTPIIVFTFHRSRGIVYSNKAWFDFSGCNAEKTYGFEYVKRIHPDDRERCLIQTDSFKKHTLNNEWSIKNVPPKGSYTVEARLLDKNNQYIWHLITYTSVDAEDLEDGMWFGTCTNINDQKLNQAKLLEDKEEAQRTIESKTIFLSNMSHEIRTPLIGISGMVRFLFDTPLTAEQLDYCHTISSSSDALLNVINDILDLSKVESGKMTLTSTWYHVRRLLEEANEFLSSMAISKSLELNYMIEDDVPMWVKGDRFRLRQVMLNLIGNAIKFTDKGEVFTRCSVIKEEKQDVPDTVLLKFEVIDTGRGFTSEDELRMFKPFSQLRSNHQYQDYSDSPTSSSSSSSCSSGSSTETAMIPSEEPKMEPVMAPPTFTSPGTGLGLVISRQLIQLQGGELSCKSKPGKGSKFVFTCRVDLPTESDKPPVEESMRVEEVTVSEVQPLDILIICPCEYAPLSIIHHIKKTVADPVNCKCTVVRNDSILREYLSGKKPFRKWTHVIINNSKSELVETAKLALECNRQFKWMMEIVLLVPLIQESTIIAGINGAGAVGPQKLPPSVRVLHKPVTPTKYSLVFDPSKQREASRDLKMRNAQEVLENQKDIFKTIQQFVGDRRKDEESGGSGTRTENGKLNTDEGPMRVLLAEDNPVNQKVMGRFFDKAGLEYEIAKDGVECTRKVFEHARGYYGLIICDLDMPRKNGFETCKEIREWERQQDAATGKPECPVAIVALSAYVMSDMAGQCDQAGFTRYISKPIDFGRLKDLILELLS